MEFAEFEAMSREIGAWSRRNFPGNTMAEPVMGMAEEGGELVHAILKRRQGIRHTPEECVAMERDAIGDIGIYAGDALSRIDDPVTLRTAADLAMADLLLRIASTLAAAPVLTRGDFCGVWTALEDYCSARGWDFGEIMRETWSRVGKRDWRKDPVTAGGGAS